MKKTAKKDQIIAAATELFTQNGFEGTSMADIAQLAGVNHSLIFHYFGNKEKLWVAIKQEIAHEAQDALSVLPSTEMPLDAFKVYQAKGEISATIQPAFLVTMILSIISSAALDPNVYIDTDANRKAYIDFCVASMLKAVKG